MQFSIIAIALTLGLVSSAAVPAADASPDNIIHKRDCWSSGATWGGDRGYALAHATTASQLFQGSYQPGNARVACYNLSSGKKVDFELRLRDSVDARYIGAAEAYDGLRKEIENCDKGGHTTYGNWYYRADPNDGQCA